MRKNSVGKQFGHAVNRYHFHKIFKCTSNLCFAMLNLCPLLWNRRAGIYGESLKDTTQWKGGNDS